MVWPEGLSTSTQAPSDKTLFDKMLICGGILVCMLFSEMFHHSLIQACCLSAMISSSYFAIQASKDVELAATKPKLTDWAILLPWAMSGDELIGLDIIHFSRDAIFSIFTKNASLHDWEQSFICNTTQCLVISKGNPHKKITTPIKSQKNHPICYVRACHMIVTSLWEVGWPLHEEEMAQLASHPLTLPVGFTSTSSSSSSFS